MAVERQVNNGGDLTIAPRLTTSSTSPPRDAFACVSGRVRPTARHQLQRAEPLRHRRVLEMEISYRRPGFPFFSLQAELIEDVVQSRARQSAGDPTVTLHRRPSTMAAGTAQRFGRQPHQCSAAPRGRWRRFPRLSTRDLRNDRFRLSPNFTMYPSEFSKVRLQYNYDDRKGVRPRPLPVVPVETPFLAPTLPTASTFHDVRQCTSYRSSPS